MDGEGVARELLAAARELVGADYTLKNAMVRVPLSRVGDEHVLSVFMDGRELASKKVGPDRKKAQAEFEKLTREIEKFAKKALR